MKRLLLLALFVAGCGSNRIDPPPKGEDDVSTEAAAEPDSLAGWARGARDAWAAGDSANAAPLARKAFIGAWAQAEDANSSQKQATTTERLPEVQGEEGPTPAQVTDGLTRVGLSADIVQADGVWQVLVSDPVGSSTAHTEFWAWASANAAGPPVVQALPAKAPARARYGPDAVGDLATWTSKDGKGLASAWARPRSRSGLEVALAVRKKDAFVVTSNKVLPLEADTVSWEAGNPPVLVVIGAGERDLVFDECPTCPHLERTQRWSFDGAGWRMGEEKVTLTPYAAFVSFMHALRETGPESALPYASGPEVIEQAKAVALDLGGRGPLRAAPGTTAMDPTQSYRIGGNQAIQVTLSNATGRWVVEDIRPTQIVIE